MNPIEKIAYIRESSKSFEDAFLASIIMRPVSFFEHPWLTRDHFLTDKNKHVYDAISHLSLAKLSVDSLSIIQHMDGSGVPATYISELFNGNYSTMNHHYYASQIKRYYTIFKMIGVAEFLYRIEADAKKDPEDILADAVDEMMSAVSSLTTDGEVDINSVMDEIIEDRTNFLIQKEENPDAILGYRTGFDKLDKGLRGLEDGVMWVVGAPTSVGKTWFILTMINQMLLDGHSASFFSMEMTPKEVMKRLITMRACVSFDDYMEGTLTDGENDKVSLAIESLRDSKLEISGETDLKKVKLKMVQQVMLKKADAYFVDYLGKVTNKATLSDYDTLKNAVDSFSNMSKQYNIPVVCVSQLSREHVKNGLHTGSSGFKGSGDIENATDIAIELIPLDSKEERDEKQASKTPYNLEIAVKKNRNGRGGKVDIMFEPWLGRFTEVPEIGDYMENDPRTEGAVQYGEHR